MNGWLWWKMFRPVDDFGNQLDDAVERQTRDQRLYFMAPVYWTYSRVRTQ
jgi:hypothetical protein